MKAGLRLVATVAALATTGCHDLTDTKRWSSMRWDDKNVDDVEASLYVSPAPATTDTGASNPVSAWSDRAQGAFVAALVSKTKSAQDFKDSIIKAKPDGGMATVDNRNFLLVVTLSRPAGYVPGDRIARVDLRVSPINFSFGGYTIVQTARQTYSVTALTRTAGLEENLSAGTPPGTPVTATAGIKATQGSSTVTPITESAETLSRAAFQRPSPGCFDRSTPTKVTVSTAAAYREDTGQIDGQKVPVARLPSYRQLGYGRRIKQGLRSRRSGEKQEHQDEAIHTRKLLWIACVSSIKRWPD